MTAFDEAAERLTEALEMAEGLFARTWNSPAQVDLPSGAKLLFKKRGDQGYCFLVEKYDDRIVIQSSTQVQTNHFKSTSIKTRIDVAQALPELWATCAEEQAGVLTKLTKTTEEVLEFIKHRFAAFEEMPTTGQD